MSRKRSISGRARTSSTVATNVNIQLSKVNKQFKSLRRAGEYGTYASKKVIANLNQSKYFYYNRKSKTFKISKRSKLTQSQKRLYAKQFQQFLKSKLSKPEFIKKLRAETKDKIKTTLTNVTDKELTDEDVDMFLSLQTDEDYRYIADKIGDSEAYILMNKASEQNMNVTSFRKTLSDYMTVNSQDIRDVTRRLFDKYITQ